MGPEGGASAWGWGNAGDWVLEREPQVASRYLGDGKHQSPGFQVPESSQETWDTPPRFRRGWASWGPPQPPFPQGRHLRPGLPEPSLPPSACYLGAIDGDSGGTQGVA